MKINIREKIFLFDRLYSVKILYMDIIWILIN